jgi:hypothetical protein
MSTLILIIVVVFLVGALLLALMEASGGYVGDGSMVPGCLGIMVLVVGVVLAAGFLSGHWGVWMR